MTVRFTKMHGLGNDFVVLDNRDAPVAVNPAWVRRLADRREGIGFDQLLLIEAATAPAADLAFRIFNANGGEVEHCGNGARCVAAYARARVSATASPLCLQLPTQFVAARVLPDGDVAVDMGEPSFEPAMLPFVAPERALVYTLDLDTGPIEIGAVSMGNPHAVLLSADVDEVDLRGIAEPIQKHRRFPAGVNVGVMCVQSRSLIRLRVYERGVGETRACGTGACAAVAVARSRDLVDDTVAVALPGGTLSIAWPGADAHLWMTGPATFVFEGEVEI